jgi:hypothetical protein
MLDPLRGIGGELMDLIDDKQYFVIHAARQSGKTTLLKQLTRDINTVGKYHALYCNVEAAQGWTDPEKGIPVIVEKLRLALRDSGMQNGFAAGSDGVGAASVLKDSLSTYCRTLSKPLVIFFDEADCLSEGTLITFLRQLREGYIGRVDVPFAHTVALIGMRNIRDYKAQIRKDTETIGSASPFNIAKKSLSLRNFTADEVAELYAQHTTETGQIFERQAIDHVFEQTQGQPWLVNAIACECVEKITKKDYSIPITQPFTNQAIQNLIKAWGTHFDSMMERLKEPQVRNIIEPLLLGGGMTLDVRSNDYLYTRDLGLIREIDGKVEPANPIYAELIVRTLNWSVQMSLQRDHADYEVPRYLKDGKIDVDYLLKDFQQYWRENSGIWTECYETQFYQYTEAAPHLVLQAFLQRVINGGGQIIREMALGKTRADLCMVYDGRKYPIELKILQNMRGGVNEGIEQILGYMDKVGSDVGWLVIFDRDAGKSWDEKIYTRMETVGERKVAVVGC